MEIVVKWRAESPDPMFSDPIYRSDFNLSAPEYIDVYKLSGKLLLRIDMGYNVKSSNDHETMLHVQDFNGDGRAEIILKTAPGTRVGLWDERSGRVTYPRDDRHIVGGQEGFDCTTDQFIRDFEEGERGGTEAEVVAFQRVRHLLPLPPCAARITTGPTTPTGRPGSNPTIGPMGPGHREYVTAIGYDGSQGGDTGHGGLRLPLDHGLRGRRRFCAGSHDPAGRFLHDHPAAARSGYAGQLQGAGDAGEGWLFPLPPLEISDLGSRAGEPGQPVRGRRRLPGRGKETMP